MSITERLIPACLNVSPSTAAFAWKDSGNDIFSYALNGTKPLASTEKTRLLPLL